MAATEVRQRTAVLFIAVMLAHILMISAQVNSKSGVPVIAPTGVVGRIVTLAPRAAKVQLLVDRNAGAGALVERSRAQGVVLGTGEELLRMDYVSGVADVQPGDTVVTSGIDGIYPKGF